MRPPLRRSKFPIPLLALAILSAAPLQATPPNILFIVCDDLNTHIGPAGHEAIHTPTLDAFAKDSMTFHRAFCQYPVCGPSRTSFLSGLYPESAGVTSNETDIRKARPGTVTLPEHLRKNGYWTGSIGKVFHNTRHEPTAEAWDEAIRFENDELSVVTATRKAFEAEHGSVEDQKNRKAWKAAAKEAKSTLDRQTPPGYGPTGLADHQHKDGKNARQAAT